MMILPYRLMREEYYKWYSPHVSRDMEMLVFGHSGMPIILFPTSKGRYYENKDFKLIESVRWFLENGMARIYCPDSMDAASWYNRSIHPADRVRTHNAYERLIVNEVVKKAMQDTGWGKVAFAGASFGGFHAMNFGLRNPWLTSYIFSMSGAYDPGTFMDGYSDLNVYYNSPLQYMSGMGESETLWHIRKVGIVMGVPEHDAMKGQNDQLAHIFYTKGVRYWYDYRPGWNHDWPVWRHMFPHYISTALRNG